MQERLPEVVLILIASTSIILLLITLVVISLFISQRRKFRHKQELTNVRYAYEQEVLQTQLETQLQTFESISQELHDNVGTLVSMAIVHLNSVNGADSGKHLLETNKLLDEAMSTLRDLSRSINPENIRKQGLMQAMKNEVMRLKRSGRWDVQFNTRGDAFPMEPETEIIFFRVFQEALNNVIKHSGATKIDVSLAFQQPMVTLSIVDDGKGFVFAPDSGEFVDKSGLRNMRKRAQLINASLAINPTMGKGTEVILRYPEKYPINMG